MDAEPTLSGLSEVVYCAIPDRGATWGDLVREVRPPSNEAMEFALKGLRTAKLVVLHAAGEVGIWKRSVASPNGAGEDANWRRTLRLPEPPKPRRARTEARSRYDKHGRRLCTDCRVFRPVNQFHAGNGRDGLDPYCKVCRKIRRRVQR